MRRFIVLLAVLCVGFIWAVPSQAHHRPWHNPTTTTAPEPTTTTLPPTARPALGVWSNTSEASWRSELDSLETTYGPFEGYWRNYHPQGSGWPNAEELAALADGKRLFLNAKPGGTWAAVAGGSYDATISNSLRTLGGRCAPRQCLVTFWHEPISELLAGTYGAASDYVAMWRYLDQLRDTHAPQVQLAWTMEGFEANQPTYLQLWPGSEVVDVIGHDPYVRADEDPSRLATKIISRSLWFRANLAGAGSLPVVIAEFGADLGGRGTDAHRAQALNGITARLGEIAAAGVVELDYFNARTNWLSAGVDGQAFADLKVATEH